MGAVAKSYMRKGFLKYEEMRKYLTKYEEAVSQCDFATAPFWISLYMRKFFFFISVEALVWAYYIDKFCLDETESE